MARISLKDIAKAAGVSVTTVSFVINNKAREKRISEQVVEKVNKLIREKNFTPNTIARGLRTGKSTSLGLIVEDIGNHFFGNVAKTIEMTAYKKGYKVLYSSTDNSEKKARELLDMMKNQQVDGYIITPTRGMRSAIAQLKKEKKPFVLFDRYFPDLETNYVVLDNFKGAYDMTEYLIGKSYKNIAFITIKNGMNQMRNRKHGFQRAIADLGKGKTQGQVLELPYEITEEMNLSRLSEFMDSNPDVDALFFATNYLGILGIQYTLLKSLSIPEDIALVSFDDHDLFRLQKIRISVVAQPIEKMAEEAIDILMKLMTGEHPELMQKVISPELLIRDSA
jgi:LacI family transcriptional regulator